jgi:D-sedoheptulose 7-phosphate isomerase
MDNARINLIESHFRESAGVKLATLHAASGAILAAAGLVAESFRQGGKVMLCGNGGSAADAQHLAAEFTSLLRQDFPRPGLPAIALSTDTSYLTARSNDFGFDGVYARLVESLGRPGDVLIGISTSGNSRNVLAAFTVAQGRGIKTIGLTGAGGGKMATLSDLLLAVTSAKTQHIQETHITIGHVICQLVEEELFPSRPSSA